MNMEFPDTLNRTVPSFKGATSSLTLPILYLDDSQELEVRTPRFGTNDASVGDARLPLWHMNSNDDGFQANRALNSNRLDSWNGRV
jgi:hypothetical protein